MESVFFWLSKLSWLLISPHSVLFLWLCVGIGLLWTNRNSGAKCVLTSLSISLLFLGLFPVGEWILIPLENRYPPNPPLDNIDGVIVLSGAEQPRLASIRNQVAVHGAAERGLAFMMIARRFPNTRLLFTGGNSSLLNQQYKAADVAERMFAEQGLDVSQIVFERDSRNTYESVVLSKSLMKPRSNQDWVLITTSWHMPRSMGVFCRAGWNVIPYPVDFETDGIISFKIDWDLGEKLRLISVGMHEWLGILVYRLTKKSC